MTLGCVTSFYDLSTSARVLIGPDGTSISTAGTQTAGVNEGIAYAVSNSWAFKCLPHEEIICATGLNIPACAGADIDLGGSDFRFGSTCTSSALSMDSFNGGRFYHSGRLLYSGSAPYAVHLHPSVNALGQKIIQNADLRFGSLQIGGVNTPIGVYYDLTHGTIMNNKNLDWLMIDGWDGAHNRMLYGLYVSTPSDDQNGFNENMIRIGQMQGFSSIGILDGQAGQYAIAIGDNEWDVMLNSTGLAGEQPVAFIDTYASYDEWRISATIYTGSCGAGIIFQAGANYNSYKIRQSTAGTAVQDYGTGNRAI